VKRIILRVLETPVKGMGMDSPELLLLVENCPKGAETLVTRIIHILTDKGMKLPRYMFWRKKCIESGINFSIGFYLTVLVLFDIRF
jgi:hypothetical protein